MRESATVRTMLPTLLVVMLLLSGIPGAFASSGVVLDTQQVFEPSPGANRRFGHSVAVDGDTAVIGAVGATTSAGANRGAAYVYVRTLSGWQHQATLAADDGQSGDYFGSTVVIEGDTIVVSAIYADPRGNNSGAAYVFTRSGTAWTQRAKLVPSDSAADDYCGGALAISGPMVFVGSGRHNGFRGAVWLFTEAGGSWTETRKFSEDIAEQSRFGDAIAISGSRLLIAAPWESLDGLDRAGKVYTYRLGTSGWASGGTIAPDTPVADGRFGAALAFDGTRAAVGFPGWSSSVGAVHVFDPPATALGTRWVRTQTITRTEPVEEFGQAVKLAGGRMLVDESAQGRVFSYTADDGSTWIPEATIDGLGPVDRCALGGDTALLSISTDDTHGSASGTAHFVTLRAMPPALPGGAHRVAGLNRYLTSVAASKRAFLSASTVVVATGDNWPDALGGSALAGAVEGPLLLTSSASLPSGVRDEIVRLKAKKVYVLGGKAAVSDTVLNQIKGIPGVTSVERVSGNDRYGTARAIADKAIAELNARGTYSGGALVATGGNFPDATAASPL
ncbi:MAG: cell wall-binding repeat-containing protein, partial [Aeromicrobium sp.]|nr:cell wall-binding repeat-containing protein [Aeromicrobium sp.]